MSSTAEITILVQDLSGGPLREHIVEVWIRLEAIGDEEGIDSTDNENKESWG